jgi:uncharacterized membrane protein YesL
MRIWLRRFMVMALIGGFAVLAIAILLVEIVLSAFMPMPALQVLLPVCFLVAGIAGWRLTLMLYRWAPGADG